MKEGATAIFRLFRIELRKVFKGKTVYAIALVLIFLTAVGMQGLTSGYSRQVSNLEDQHSEIISRIESGIWDIYGVALPEDFNFLDHPIIDDNGQIIQENVELYKSFYREYFQGEIDALTAEGGYYSFSQIAASGARQMASLIPILAVIMSVSLFASEFRGGLYRIIISRGVRRSDLISAKMLTSTTLALLFATILTVALLLGALAAYSSLGLDTPPDVSTAAFSGILGLALLMFFAYMMLGGAVGTLLASSSSAMAIGLVLAFLAGTLFFNATPCMEGFFGTISPVTLGYNFSSLMHHLWQPIGGIEGMVSPGQRDCYRDVGIALTLALTYTAAFTGFIYSVFMNKDLKG